MIICIGKIEKDTRGLEACRLVDSISKEVRILSMSKIKKLIESGIPIKGFILAEPNNFYTKVNTILKKENTNQFRFSKMPKLNGEGELVNPEDERFLTVYAWEGFAESRKYHLFNYKGETVILTKQEFIEKVRKKEVNGACIHSKTGKVLMSNSLNMEAN